MLATKVIYVDEILLETIYGTAFLLACLAMALLGRWTTKSLMLFIAIVAVLFVCCKTAREVYRRYQPNYVVEIPVSMETPTREKAHGSVIATEGLRAPVIPEAGTARCPRARNRLT